MGNKIFLLVILVILIGAGSFFAGMKYQESKIQNLRGNIFQGGQFRQRLGGGGLRPVNGTIIGKDESSITVELADKSSKIIILTDSTSISKFDEASAEDLKEGEPVVVFGQENSDGSLTAQNIQLNPVFGRSL